MARLQLNNLLEIQYELIDGLEGKPYLVFLHEGLGCIAMWKDFPRMLCEATGCPCLVYDRIGYGKSSPLTGTRTIHYLHEYGLFELPEVLSKLIPMERYFLIGHSDGGSIALIHAAEKPPGLLGIITEAAHVFVDEETLAGIRLATEAYSKGKLREALLRFHQEKTDEIFKAWYVTWLSSWFQYWNLEYLLPSVVCPVLAIQGAEDQYGTPAQINSIAAKTERGQKALVAECGHAPHQEKPDITLQLMTRFLQSHIPGQ